MSELRLLPGLRLQLVLRLLLLGIWGQAQVPVLPRDLVSLPMAQGEVGMNDREREEWRPLCNRCGQVVTDIRWVDVMALGEPTEYAPGQMRCSTPDCYDERGSHETGPLEPGGLTLMDHAWLRQHRTIARRTD